MTELVLIVAHDQQLLIGKNGALPWRIPEDLKHFKRITTGYPILMGRGVYEEIGCKPLPNRRNIVLTSRNYDNVEVYRDIPQALKSLSAEPKVFVIGGAQIYRQLIDQCSYMYVTLVQGAYEGDVYFPEYRMDIGTKWGLVSEEKHDSFSFLEYKRIHKVGS